MIMARVYISFLGTNDYLSCTYFHEEDEIQDIRFVQEATLNFFCKTWKPEDRIVIFTTEEANRKNWQDNGHGHPCKGLESCIKDLNLDAQITPVPIPAGKSEAEIWNIFRIVYELLHPNDEVIFDITHAFRSIPMLAIVILNYAKVMKNITLKGIYYGAFEVLGSIRDAQKIPLSERRVPILDLTAFDQLMEWSFAVDRFLKAGDAHQVSSLAEKSVKPALMVTKGQDTAAKTIRNMAKNLEEFTKTLSTCRGRNISMATTRLKQNINQCQGLELIQPFKPIFDRIKDQIDPFSGDPIADGIQAAKWCLEHNLVQQGYTIFQETLISYFIIKINEEPEGINREIATQAAKIYLDNLPVAQWKSLARTHEKTTRKFLEFYRTKDELIKIYRNLSGDRNDLNHAGHKPTPMKADKFSLKLRDYIQKTEQHIMP